MTATTEIIFRKVDDLSEAIDMLRRLEWGGASVKLYGQIGPACPICMASPRDGHSRKGCALNEILKKHPK